MVGVAIPSCRVYPTRFAIARKTTGGNRATFRPSTTKKVVSPSMTSDFCSMSSSSVDNVETSLVANKKCAEASDDPICCPTICALKNLVPPTHSIIPRDDVTSTDPGSGESSTVSGSDISDAGVSSEGEGGDDSSFGSIVDDTGLSTGTCCHHHHEWGCNPTYSVAHLLQIRETLGTCAPILSYITRSANDSDTGLLINEGVSVPSTNGLSNKDVVADSTQIAALPPWKKRRHRITNEDAIDAKVARIARAVLNKLTVERFAVLYEKIVDCIMKYPQQLAILVREIFDIAITQHNFIGMYVDLCLSLEADPRLKPIFCESICKISTFKRLLLNQCQYSFEGLLTMQCCEGVNKENMDEDALEETRLRRKQCALGNIKLIGQLLVHGMLSSKFLVTCCEELLGRRKECPEALEALSTLLTVTGPTFDSRPDWPWRPRLEAVFSMIRDLVANRGLAEMTSRVRFLLRDLLDLRDACWIDNKQAKTGVKGPKRLEEVRKEAAMSSFAIKSGTEPSKVCRNRSTMMQTPQTQLIDNHIRELCSKIIEKQECASCCQRPIRATGKQDAMQRYTTAQLAPSNKATYVATTMVTTELTTTAAEEGSAKEIPQAQLACNKTQAHNQALMTCRKNKTQKREDSYMKAVATVVADADTATREFVPQSFSSLPTPNRYHRINALKKCDTSLPAPCEAFVTSLQTFQSTPVVLQTQPFNLRTFRYETTATLRDLASNRDVAGAIHRIRVQQVPPRQQAIEFADMLTRVAEETRGPARRVAFTFLANLANSENNVFDKMECVNGIKMFFDEIYEGLCTEVPRLPAIVSTELVPTLRSVFSVVELDSIIPNDFDTQ